MGMWQSGLMHSTANREHVSVVGSNPTMPAGVNMITVLGKVICPGCKKVYMVINKMPKPKEKCYICKGYPAETLYTEVR